MAVREKVQTQELYNATLAELNLKKTELDSLNEAHAQLQMKSQDQESEMADLQDKYLRLQSQSNEMLQQ